MPYQANAAEPNAADLLPPESLAKFNVLDAQRKSLIAELPQGATQRAYAGTFRQPEATHRLHRGDPMQPREQVLPASIACLGNSFALPGDTPEGERRLTLARWIADERNPRTARVLVNRVWQYHFGRALAPSTSDLGWHGAKPSHAELLDWLACEFMAGGWRIKSLSRLIVLSSTYRQSARGDRTAEARDAMNRWLWRYPPRRLEAEALRDAVLATSGMLDLRMLGPGYDVFERNTNYVKVYTPKTQFGAAEWRRMVYQARPRMVPEPTFGAFDCPDASRVAPRRNVSTTALQALNLLNSPFMFEQSKFFAERLRRECGSDARAQVQRAFLLAFSRQPDEEELNAALDVVARHGLDFVCRALFNANEFLYLN